MGQKTASIPKCKFVKENDRKKWIINQINRNSVHNLQETVASGNRRGWETRASSQTLTRHDPAYYGFHHPGMVHSHPHCVPILFVSPLYHRGTPGHFSSWFNWQKKNANGDNSSNTSWFYVFTLSSHTLLDPDGSVTLLRVLFGEESWGRTCWGPSTFTGTSEKSELLIKD